jgi:hypothetical protein
MSNEPNELSDEVLVSYADGQISKTEMERLEPLINSDPDAKVRLKNFQDSNSLIKDFFDVDVPEKTPENIAKRIRSLSQEAQSQPEKSNVVSFSAYRERVKVSISTIASGNGWQKIAASLVVGGFLGFGVAPQYMAEAPGQNDGYQIASVPDDNPNFVIRGKQTNGEVRSLPHEVNDSEYLYLFNGQVKYFNGEQIDFSKKYRIQINIPKDGSLTITYREPSGNSEIIIDNESLLKGEYVFPKLDDQGVNFTTDDDHILFDMVINYGGSEIRRMFIFPSSR